MGKELIVFGVALLLSGCGGYFDQHPPNVRPEADAVATVLARQRPVVSAQSGPVTTSRGAATRPQVVENVAASPSASLQVHSAPPPQPTPAVAMQPVPQTARLLAPAPAPQRLLPPASSRTPEGPPAAPKKAPTNPVPAVPAFSTPPANAGIARPAPVVTPAETAAVAPIVAPSRPRLQAEPAPLPQTAPMAAKIHDQSVPEENTENPSAPVEVHSRVTVQPAPAVVMQPVPETLPVPAASPPPVAPAAALAPSVPDARCEAVAKQRADDAGANGLDRETQEIVRRGAYVDCLAWYREHPAPLP